ncbi:MAG TPA: EamA family transporter [Rubrobacteraceae bacterium]|nr:EamA family transporter [Rubrobacteraceae bacterium]
MAAGFGVEPSKAPNVIGAAVSSRGVGLILGEGFEGGGLSLDGDVLALIAAVSFGAYSVLSRAQQRHYSPLNIATYSTLFGGLTPFLLTPAELAGWTQTVVFETLLSPVPYQLLYAYQAVPKLIPKSKCQHLATLISIEIPEATRLL